MKLIYIMFCTGKAIRAIKRTKRNIQTSKQVHLEPNHAPQVDMSALTPPPTSGLIALGTH